MTRTLNPAQTAGPWAPRPLPQSLEGQLGTPRSKSPIHPEAPAPQEQLQDSSKRAQGPKPQPGVGAGPVTCPHHHPYLPHPCWPSWTQNLVTQHVLITHHSPNLPEKPFLLVGSRSRGRSRPGDMCSHSLPYRPLAHSITHSLTRFPAKWGLEGPFALHQPRPRAGDPPSTPLAPAPPSLLPLQVARQELPTNFQPPCPGGLPRATLLGLHPLPCQPAQHSPGCPIPGDSGTERRA